MTDTVTTHTFIHRYARHPDGAALHVDPTPKTTHMTRRLDLPCESVGFVAPPGRLDLMFLEGDGTWTLLVHRASGRMRDVDQWLRRYGPIEITAGAGAAPRVLRAEFAHVPDAWSEILRAVRVRFLQLAPSGLASLFYEDDDLGVQLLLHVMRRDATAVHDRPSLGDAQASSLSVSQYDVLSVAVGLGYYDAPPRVDQQEIAARLGISLTRVSELLKEGEAKVVTSHVDASMMTTMCETLFGGRRV